MHPRVGRMSIEIASNQNYYPIKKRKIRQIVLEALKKENCKPEELSIAFVDNKEITALNKKFLSHNEPTDVLSFPLDDERPPHAGSISGEIVVSAQMALETADAMHTDVERELILYVIHGLLHLIGYDDTSKRKARVMHEREDKLLASFFQKR